jgi:hypothetical protein
MFTQSIVMHNQRGVSIIAALFIILILAFMGVMFVTLIGTDSLTSVNNLQSLQALAVAEGGVEFAQRLLSQNLDWYRTATDPAAVSLRSLGTGSFTATTYLAATKLRRRLQTGDTTISVYTTDRFPSAGFLQIEDDIAGGAEFVQYTGISGTTFTGVTRGRTIGAVATVAASHPRGSVVYPVTTLSAGLAASCASPATITIAANQKFLSTGVLDIEGEEILYTGSSTSGGMMTLTGVQRCLGSVGPVAHAAGQPVTSLLVGGETADYQAEIVSTGSAGIATRILRKSVQR